jgi:hypothetical protein
VRPDTQKSIESKLNFIYQSSSRLISLTAIKADIKELNVQLHSYDADKAELEDKIVVDLKRCETIYTTTAEKIAAIGGVWLAVYIHDIQRGITTDMSHS